MDWTRVDAVADELSATRAEVLGLVLLVLGGVVVSWLVVQRPIGMAASSDVTGVASSVTMAGAGDGPQRDADGVGMADGPVAADDLDGSADARSVAPTERQAIFVHVTGAVANPGVVELAGGDRVVDAVAAVGAATTEAALDALNMARLVVDGERIHVPTQQEVEDGVVPAPSQDGGNGSGGEAAGAGGGAGAEGGGGGGGANRDAAGRLDLNRATQADLEELPGVGPVIAGRIIAWRDANGGFEAVGQLREVTGIGERTFQSLADVVVVS